MKYAIVHLADIHYRPNEPEGVSTIIKALVKDLADQKNILAGHELYIAFAGDLVHKGADSESYIKLRDELDTSLSAIGFPKEARIAVPGNHDLDQSAVRLDPNGFQDNLNSHKDTEQDLNDFLSSGDIQDTRLANYHQFESAFVGFGTDFCSSGKGWTISGDLGVYCLNTAVCSCAGTIPAGDEKQLAINTRSLVDWCSSTPTTTNVLLMHHPVDHLNSWSQQELKSIIENNFCLCLCGHRHEQDLYFNTMSQKAVISSTPQLFTRKSDHLGYAILLLEDKSIEKIVYRQYQSSRFLNGSLFSKTDDGIVTIPSVMRANRIRLENELKIALSAYKGQPEVFIEPMLSESRSFDESENLLPDLITSPKSSVILAQPQFGQTCLCHHMRLEAYKGGNLWGYIDAKRTKGRKVVGEIEAQLSGFGATSAETRCILLDSWNGELLDHVNILKCLDKEFPDTPIIIMINYTESMFSSEFDFTKLGREFTVLHLLALQRTRVRELVDKYAKAKNIPSGDAVVTKVVRDLEALNVHRTPLNCFTLLRVIEKDATENIVNRTRLIKTVLFILFTDAESFTYASAKPDIDDCEYILGRFCKTLIEKGEREFKFTDLLDALESYCSEKLITVDVRELISILESNNILLRFGDTLEFKHSYWIYYFGATFMFHDDDFAKYILNNRRYVNFPEIIEFYTGIDGRRDEALKTLLAETEGLVQSVDGNIGIPSDFNPYESIVWNPTQEGIDALRKQISDKVQDSKLPVELKDQHADTDYNSEAPYNQTIQKFLNEYSVISLMQSIKAASRALRNSKYVDPELKIRALKTILRGWEVMARVVFVLAPTLARRGHAAYEGFGLILDESFKGVDEEKLKQIILSGPFNIVRFLKDDLSSGKIVPLVAKVLQGSITALQKHFLSHFLIRERPEGWHAAVYEHMNRLHMRSFYLWDLYNTVDNEMSIGFTTKEERVELLKLVDIISAKHADGPPATGGKAKEIPEGRMISKANKLPIDKIRAARKNRGKKKWKRGDKN